MNSLALAQKATPTLALSALLLAALTACGGGSGADSLAQPAAASGAAEAASSSQATGADSLDSSVASAMASTEVLPAYHMAPVLLDEPSQADVGGTNNSAHFTPKTFEVDGALADLPTARLNRQAVSQRIAALAKTRTASVTSESSAPLTTTLTGSVFTPAQIRAAYGLSALPATGASLTSAQAAALGAGQTIYLVDAYHDATALSDLNAFSAKFGLPTCANVAIATTTTKLATPPSSCTFSQVHATTSGTMTSTVPAYNATWTPESKLDVQWAHAIAPLARIVLIEMPDSMSTSILGASLLATKFGPGVVSMSFGSAEAGWAPTVDSYFAGTGMTFVAAAGDSGAQVIWPAVSSNVLAVGGTGMNWSGTTRTELAWSRTGGGMSAYEALPAYQSGVTPTGGSGLARRAVPDVAFNADPMTGEYVALTLPGAATVWNAYGGTSIAAPQWAGVVAVANAIRAANSKAALGGDIHTLLYKSIAAVPGTYAAALGDVTEGTNGTCATCRAGVGYDLATGWGTPNATALSNALTGVSTAVTVAAAPTVPGGSYTGKAGSALSQSLGVTAPTGTSTSYALSGAPSGLAVDTTGTLKWAAPVAGSYSFTVTATTATGKSASAKYALKVIPGTAPAFASTGKYTGTAGKAFAGTLSATNPNTGTLSYSVSGAPSGLTVSSAGALSWAAPTAGSHTFTAKVTDSYGYSSTQTETLTVAAAAATANHAPTLASATFSAKAGATFSTILTGQDVDGGSLTYTAAGIPAGMSLLSSGFLYWVTPVKGTYTLTVTVHDNKGATGSAVIKLVVA